MGWGMGGRLGRGGSAWLRTLKEPYKMMVLSHPDYEELVAEIYVEGKYIGLVSKEPVGCPCEIDSACPSARTATVAVPRRSRAATVRERINGGSPRVRLKK